MVSPDPLISFRRVPEHAGIHREELEAFAQLLVAEIASGRPFHCRITGDAELRRLNREYLGNNYATDVLSFPSGEPHFLGDLAISRQRATAQAQEFGHPLTAEIQLLLLHGVLHLLGFDHERDSGLMARTERRWQVQLGLPLSLIHRVRGAEKVTA